MINFQPIPNAAPAAGLVLRVGEADYRYLRLTHVFEDCVYAMWIGGPAEARYARRPMRKLLQEFQQLAAEPASTWGRVALPGPLTSNPLESSERALNLEVAWNLIEPLIKLFSQEANLARSIFTASIRERAAASQTSFITLHRLILRYYYFGGTRLAVLPLPPGVKHGGIVEINTPTDTAKDLKQHKRRGRQPKLAEDLGPNKFIVGAADIEDMVNCLTAGLRRGVTYKTNAHEDYLAGPFRRRHPDVYMEYISGRRVEPVTLRQYRYYVDGHAKLSDDLAKNLRTNSRNPGYLGSVYATGPGEVYEIDATGGRLYLVSAENPPVLIGKPTIYLIIDRWSRFIVSAYMTLKSASYEEVRHALLVAFTSRETRFQALGVDINEERWPVGQMPAVLCPDRGSDFMSKSMEQAVVQDLRIELTPLPPFCPDGKAIVERMIREIKRRMAASALKGVYADRPMDPQSKRAAKKAKVAAVHSLAEAYRVLIEIVDDHNNRPHSALKRRRILTQAGVEPTPKNAYLWGITHISGLRKPPLTEADYRRLLLSVDVGNLANGVLRYKSRSYLPVNEAAFNLAAKSTTRAKQIGIRLDRTYPYEIEVQTAHEEWALFRITIGAAGELMGMSLDEEEAMSSQTAKLWARAEHRARVERVAAKTTKIGTSKKRRGPVATIDKQQQLIARAQETSDMKYRLSSSSLSPPQDVISTDSQPEEDWLQLEEQDRLRTLGLIRKHRSKR